MSRSTNRGKLDQEATSGRNVFAFSDRIAERLLLTVERLCKLFIAWTKVVVPLALTLVLVTCSQNKPLPSEKFPQQTEQIPSM